MPTVFPLATESAINGYLRWEISLTRCKLATTQISAYNNPPKNIARRDKADNP